MKKNNYDERVISERRKIQSDLAQILLCVLLISVFVQQFIFKYELKAYIVELLCFIFSGFYILFRNIVKGIDIVKDSNIKMNVSVTSIVTTIVFGTQNYMTYKEKYTGIFDFHFLMGVLIFFISVTLTSTLMFCGIKYLNDRKQKKINEKLDDEDIDLDK